MLVRTDNKTFLYISSFHKEPPLEGHKSNFEILRAKFPSFQANLYRLMLLSNCKVVSVPPFAVISGANVSCHPRMDELEVLSTVCRPHISPHHLRYHPSSFGRFPSFYSLTKIVSKCSTSFQEPGVPRPDATSSTRSFSVMENACRTSSVALKRNQS